MTAAEKLRISKDEFISKISRLIKAYGYASFICDKHIRETDVSPNGNTIRMAHEQVAIDFARSEGFSVSYKHNSYGVRYYEHKSNKIQVALLLGLPVNQ